MTSTRRIRTLIVDDSAFVRRALVIGLSTDPGIEVVGVACDAYEARDKIVQHRPDVMTLDIEMPRMDGLEFLRRLMPQHPLPVVVISSLTEKGSETALRAMELGAVDVVAKPGGHLGGGLEAMMAELRTRVKIASAANVGHLKQVRIEPVRASGSMLRDTTDKVIALGASTGGTEAIRVVLQAMPVTVPGIVIVQHMPPGFTKKFADRLNELCEIVVKEAEEGDRVIPGRALIAPGDRHMRLKKSGGQYVVSCEGTDRVNGHCPSVDVLMESVASSAGRNAVGIMLTGMGRDGAGGMLAMRKAGARTVAQDEATSVVFGMPKEAHANGGAECLKPLEEITSVAMEYLTRMEKGD